MQNSRINAFSIEKKRDFFAKNSLYKRLLSTYSKNYPEVVNKNSPKLWDKLNREETISKKNNPMAWDRFNIVKRWVRGRKILDIGFGQAILEKIIENQIIDRTYEWHGIDISSDSVKKASKLIPSANFKVGKISRLPYINDYFDCVIILEVLEHIQPSKIFRSLREVNRVLRKNGILIISVPLNEDLEFLVKSKTNFNAHLRQYTPSLINAELEISGFNIVKHRKIYAFHTFYSLKTFVARYMLKDLKKPNNIIILANKI